MKHILFLTFFFLIISFSKSQEIKYKLNSQTTISDKKQLPFWLVNNKNGVIEDTNNSLLEAFVYKERTDSVFDYTFGADTYSSYFNDKFKSIINQYYLDINYKKWFVSFGAKNPTVYYDNLSMSGDNIVMTGNARPYPKIEFGSSDYLEVPFTKGKLFVKGVFSNGWMLDTRYVEDVMIHHKNAYIRYGKEKGFSVEFGLEHYAQWGGTSPKLGKMPSGIKDFARIILAKEGTDKNVMTEYENALGNHIGQNQLKFNYNTNKFNSTFFIRNMFEDRSQDIRKIYKSPDDLTDLNYGLYIKFKEIKTISSIMLEYYSTMKQGNLGFHSAGITVGYDHNFNNGVYASGWSNYNRGFGIPLNSPTHFREDNSIYFANTTFKAFNIGIQGEYKKYQYMFKYTYHKNYGQVKNVAEGKPYKPDMYKKRYYTVDPAEHQNYFLFKVILPEYNLPFRVSSSLGYDLGDISKNFGFSISIFKQGIF